jgi:hypothetical protein
LGFIDRRAADQQSAFKTGREEFSFRYGLTNTRPDATQRSMTILSKASLIYFNRKNTIKAAEMLDSIRFTDSAIVYRQPHETHTISAKYNGLTRHELQPFSSALKDAIYLYIQDYRIPPERIEFSKSANGPAGYILTLSGGKGSAGYVMRFITPH